jgi:hypothetical protein
MENDVIVMGIDNITAKVLISLLELTSVRLSYNYYR